MKNREGKWKKCKFIFLIVPEGKKNPKSWGMILRKKGSKEKKNKTEKCPENEPNVAIEWLNISW